jgi:hypothetical protein
MPFSAIPFHEFYINSGAIILMSENSNTEKNSTTESLPDVHQEEISYHAVEKNGKITAIWEMRGRKHIRTIDPRSEEGRHLLGHTENPEAVHTAQV